MKIEEAIEFLEEQKQSGNEPMPPDRLGINLLLEGVIKVIKHGEKFEKMWYETRDKFVYIEQMNFPIKRYTYENIMSVMNELKQKYFPETIKKYITIEVESEKESEVDNGMEDIKELVDNMGCPKMKISDSGFIKVDKK